MNKKTILNRTLPLIIAIFVILIVALCVTLFSGDKDNPRVKNPEADYLVIDLGYSTPVKVNKGEVYEKLKNNGNGLTYLVNLIDSKLFETAELKSYYTAVTEEQIKEAIEEEIFGKDYEFDPENTESDVEKIKTYIDKMFISYGFAIDANHIEIKDSALVVTLTGEDDLVKYYTLSLARKAYAREKMGEDQKEAYEEYIKAYEEYLVELYKYETDEKDEAPTKPTDAAIITGSKVQSDFEADNKDNYWALIVTYDTKAEAEMALLQVGVVLYNTKWYQYQGQIDLNDYKKDNGTNEYATLADYYAKKGVALNKYEIQLKLIELYNNSKNPNKELFLTEGVHYTLSELTKAEYTALTDELKEEKYTEIKASEDAEPVYKAVLFGTETVKNDEGEVDAENPANALYYTSDDLTAMSSSMLTYIKNLNSLYVDDSVWTKCYSNSIQTKGDDQVLALKIATEEGIEFDSEEGFGKFYDEDKFDELTKADDSKVDDVKALQIGYVPYTKDAEGKLVFDYTNNKYWAKVEELLDEAVSSTNINKYMDALRVEKGLIIYDANLESAYTTTYTSEYEKTKKENKEVVAKLEWKNEAGEKVEIKITAEDLYNALDGAFGAITAFDAYQYHNVLSQNDVIDYEKYLNGEDLDDCVYITEYALAKAGSLEPVTKWAKVDADGEVVFSKVNGTETYDVLVRKYVKGDEKKVEKFEAIEVEVEDDTASKTTITVTVSDEVDYQDAESQYEALDDTIAALKVYFTNGNFTDYGFDPSYGWKNFLRDYFSTYYGITVENNDDLRLYYIYEATVADITEELIKTDEEAYNNIYLPYMIQTYTKFFSVDAFHFLISVSDEEGKMLDPEEENAWTEEQKAAAETLYDQVFSILSKTTASKQGAVLQDIVDAFDSAPKFVAGVDQTTEAQQEAIKNNPIYDEKAPNGEVVGSSIEFTATFKGVTINVSEYKTLGLTVKYEDLGTVTSGQMVERFEDAMKLMWDIAHMNDAGMQSGEVLDTVKFYDEVDGDYLVTEFGYHVVVATSFGARSSATVGKVKEPLKVPSLAHIQLYEKGGEEVDELLDHELTAVETYYSKIAEDYASSYYYQLSVMQQLLEDIKVEGKLSFVNADNKAKVEKIAEYYIDTYYSSLTYISVGYDHAMDLMEIFTDAYNGYAFAKENASDAAYLDKFVVTTDQLSTLLAAAEKALEAEFEMTQSEQEAFDELKAEYLVAKEAFNK